MPFIMFIPNTTHMLNHHSYIDNAINNTTVTFQTLIACCIHNPQKSHNDIYPQNTIVKDFSLSSMKSNKDATWTVS